MRSKILALTGLFLFALILYFPAKLGATARQQLAAASDASMYLPMVLRPPELGTDGTQVPTVGTIPTNTPSPTGTDTQGETATASETPTQPETPTETYTPSETPTETFTPSQTPTETYTPFQTPTETFTPSQIPSETYTPSQTPTETYTPSRTPTTSSSAGAFSFASLSDAHANTTNFTKTTNQVKALKPNLVLLNGDYTNSGVYANDSDGQLNSMTKVLGSAGLFNNAFIVRGNHDNTQSGSSTNWESFFNSRLGTTRSLPAGVTKYVAMNSSSTYLTYSFDYGNARFIGVDVPGAAGLLTSAQYTFMDARLGNAESLGLTHAFIFFHGPEYCMESTHCTCTARTDKSCTPSAFISLVNKHPIVSATFHGHEHALAYVHMDSTRISTLTHPYEEFLTSSSGNPYSFTTYTNRVDASYSSSSSMSFALISVNGSKFTVYFYRVGSTTPLWSKTFSK